MINGKVSIKFRLESKKALFMAAPGTFKGNSDVLVVATVAISTKASHRSACDKILFLTIHSRLLHWLWSCKWHSNVLKVHYLTDILTIVIVVEVARLTDR